MKLSKNFDIDTSEFPTQQEFMANLENQVRPWLHEIKNSPEFEDWDFKDVVLSVERDNLVQPQFVVVKATAVFAAKENRS